jgi:hypothetical protein
MSSSQICICCGEPMSPEKNHLSRAAHVCSSCSSLLVGMGEAPLEERLLSLMTQASSKVLNMMRSLRPTPGFERLDTLRRSFILLHFSSPTCSPDVTKKAHRDGPPLSSNLLIGSILRDAACYAVSPQIP